MLAYASDRRRLAERHSAPHAMLFIVGAHVAAIAAVMSVKMDLPTILDPTRTETYNVPLPKKRLPPPPPVDEPRPSPSDSAIDTPTTVIPVPPQPGPAIDLQPLPLPGTGPVIGPAVDPQQLPLPSRRPVAKPVRIGPRFATPERDLKPPYPTSKLAREEQASLKLRLSIDARGRVTAVEPVGPADPAFLDAARRHLIAKWRYTPATEDGRAVASSTVITLRFELEG